MTIVMFDEQHARKGDPSRPEDVERTKSRTQDILGRFQNLLMLIEYEEGMSEDDFMNIDTIMDACHHIAVKGMAIIEVANAEVVKRSNT